MGGHGDSARTSLVGVFEVVLWGYDRDQVNQCIGELEVRLAALYDDQLRVDDLKTEVRVLRQHAAALRGRLAADTPSVHPTSGELAGILALAEREAAEIRADAARELADARAEAARTLAVAKHEAARARRDCDAVLAEYRRRRRAEADQMLVAARDEAARVLSEAHAAAS